MILQVPGQGALTKVVKDTSFLGNDTAWTAFLQKNLNAAVPVENGAPAGTYTVWVQFIVDVGGTVSDVKALTSFGYGMEAEVVRILRKATAWQPASQNAKPLRVYRKKSLTFMVSFEGFDISPSIIEADKDIEVTIEAAGVKSENLIVTISRGSITRNEDGKLTAHVGSGNRVLINVQNKKKKKQAWSASLEVKTPFLPVK